MPEDSSELMSLLAEAEEVSKPDVGNLGVLTDLVQKLIALQAEKSEADARAADLGKQITQIEEKDIPVLLDQLHLRGLDLDDGRSLGIKETYVGKIPEEKKQAAFQWLEEHGFGTLIKTEVQAQFGMGQLDKAKELAERLAADSFVVNVEQAVHPGTLGKFVKGQLTSGKDIPQELFNPMVLRRAKIS
jgi:hypothetical protein